MKIELADEFNVMLEVLKILLLGGAKKSVLYDLVRGV